MKNILYHLYAMIFNICRIFPIKENRVVFLSPNTSFFSDSSGEMAALFEKKGGRELLFISRPDGIKGLFSFFVTGPAKLATAKYVFLSDNFMPMGSLNFSRKAVITQLWHAEGAFKKFGLSLPLDEKIRNRVKKGTAKLSFVICSGEGVRDIYAEAFGIEKEKVLPLGSPRADKLLSFGSTDKLREEFDEKYPALRGKKLILYAPTFRDDAETDKRLTDSFDAGKVKEAAGEDCAVLVRLHPGIHSGSVPEGAVDVTDYPSFSHLALLCDTLITDYSSVCMDFALLGKRCIFYAFDLEEYISRRPFYFDYGSFVPGPVVKDIPSLCEALKGDDLFAEKRKDFISVCFRADMGHSAEDIYNVITAG